MPERHFPEPWSVEELDSCFVVKDLNGQALAYMVGRLEIERIRCLAQQRLGARFDIRSFHDTVLGNGPLPLRVLEQVVLG